MSLKAFHVLFVTVSIALCVGVGFWALREYRARGDVTTLLSGLFSLATAVVLLVYGRWFLRKLRGVGYL